MDTNNIGWWIIRILFFTFYIIIPAVNIIETLSRIALRKKIKNDAGELLLLQNRARQQGVILNLIIVIIGLLLILFYSKLIGVLILIQGLTFTVNSIIYNKNIFNNGIYKNGLILNNYLPWNEVHSYKIINNTTVSFLLETGQRIDFNQIENVSNIQSVLDTNNIKYVE